MIRFFSDRLANHIPLKTLFWRDMILFGAVLNLTFLGIALVMAAHEWPAWLAFVVFLLPLPYTIFMWHCVWRVSAGLGPVARPALRSIATGWLLLLVVL